MIQIIPFGTIPERIELYRNNQGRTVTIDPVREDWSPQMPETRPQSLGTFVRERRKVHGMTQVELAELAGVGTRFISELERGKPSIRMDVANQVLAIFGKELGVINGRKEE